MQCMVCVAICNARCILTFCYFAMYMVVHSYIHKVISRCLKTVTRVPVTGFFFIRSIIYHWHWKWSGISSTHVSNTMKWKRLCVCILIAQEPGTYRCIPTSPDNDKWSLNETQMDYVRQMGLHHLAETEDMRIDHALITRLVERRCTKINTFHFPISEAWVTLDDVTYTN